VSAKLIIQANLIGLSWT